MSQQDKKITLAEAIALTSDWRSNNPTPSKAFLIPAEALEGILNEINHQPGDQYARFYLGYDPSSQEEKLVMVGTEPEVQKDGKIIYRDLITSYRGTGDIYDFTDPCPPHCDPDSPLN